MPAFPKLSPEEVAIEGSHEEVLGLLLDLLVPSAVDRHEVLVMDLLLLLQSSFCMGFDVLADVVDFEHLVLQGGVFIFQDFSLAVEALSRSGVACPRWFEHDCPWCHSWTVA